MLEYFLRLMSSLVELVLPRVCISCGCYGMQWCAECFAAELRPRLHRPDPLPPGFPELAAASTYAGGFRQAVLAAKERDRRELDSALGAAMAAAIALVLLPLPWPDVGRPSLAARLGETWLVPIPASPAARRTRGRDHVADWTDHAVRILRRTGLPVVRVPLLARRRGGQDSVGLDAAGRAANLAGAFVVRRMSRAPPRTIVIVDDVVTTGATLSSAVACVAICFADAELDVRAAVVAATQRLDVRGVSFSVDTGRSLGVGPSSN